MRKHQFAGHDNSLVALNCLNFLRRGRQSNYYKYKIKVRVLLFYFILSDQYFLYKNVIELVCEI